MKKENRKSHDAVPLSAPNYRDNAAAQFAAVAIKETTIIYRQ
jgi:hypothetical protein